MVFTPALLPFTSGSHQFVSEKYETVIGKQPTGNNNIEIDLLIYVCDRLASVPQERRDKTASADFLAHLVNNLC